MAKFCTTCWEMYKNKIESKGGNNCPKASCDGVVSEINDVIAPAIQLLNEKGYSTVSSEHPSIEEFGGISAIEFDFFVEDLPSLPKGYKVVKTSKKSCMRIEKQFREKERSRKLNDIYNSGMALLVWAESLQNILSDIEDIFSIFNVVMAQEEEKTFSEEEMKEIQNTGIIKLNGDDKE